MRDLINIVEKTLYRGDASKIDKFEYKMTDNRGLFGRGIYLTDQPEIANDYTYKGSEHRIFHTKKAKDQRDVVAQYLKSLIVKKFDYHEKAKAAISKVRDEYFENHGFEKVSQEEHEKLRTEFNAKVSAATGAIVTDLLTKAKAQFETEKADLRIGKDTMGGWYIVKSAHAGHVTQFEVPDALFDRFLHAERPMPDAVVEFFGTLFDSRGRGRIDMRDAKGNMVSYRDWLKAYRTKGIDYAWADKNRIRRGPGNPTFDELRNGTHFGNWWFAEDKNAEIVVHGLSALGYVGLQYDGGTRVGAHVRGLGGMKHNCYVFWDDDLVHSFEKSASPYELAGVPADADKPITASRKLFRNMEDDDRW